MVPWTIKVTALLRALWLWRHPSCQRVMAQSAVLPLLSAAARNAARQCGPGRLELVASDLCMASNSLALRAALPGSIVEIACIPGYSRPRSTLPQHWLSGGTFNLLAAQQQHSSAAGRSVAASCRALSTEAQAPGSKVSRLGTSVPGRAAAEPAPTDPLSGSVAGSLSKSFWASHPQAFRAIPPVPKFLGFAGLIPFVALNPVVVAYLGFTDIARDAAAGQVAYGALIVSFLGAVHWGIAMSSTLSGTKALRVQRERYVWSVFPSISVWPALMMEPGPGSLCVAVMLGICYMSDKAHAKTGSLPAWYMTLRGYLTLTAMLSMLATTAWFLSQDYEKMKKQMEEDDKKKDARLFPRPSSAAPHSAGNGAAALVVAPTPQDVPRSWRPAAQAAPAAEKKGWW